MIILTSKTVKIRKPCFCFGCGREMPKGSVMVRNDSVRDGTFMHLKWCSVCVEYWSEYMDDGDEISEGDLRTENPENWEAIREEMEIDKGGE